MGKCCCSIRPRYTDNIPKTMMRTVFTSALLAGMALADIPVNCMVDDFWGSWTFDLGLQGSAAQVTNSTKYVNLGAVTGSKSFTFSPDNMVVNDQGIEFIIDEQMWWANFFFNAGGYSCDKTSVGYVHDTVGRNWARIQGTRQTDAAIEVQPFSRPDELAALERSARDGPARYRKFRKNQDFINEINSRNQGFWTAKHNT